MQALVPAQDGLVQVRLQVRPDHQNLQHRRSEQHSNFIPFNPGNHIRRHDRVEPEQRREGDGNGGEIEKKFIEGPAGDDGEIPAELVGAEPEGSGGTGGRGEEDGGEESGEGGEGGAGGRGDVEVEEIAGGGDGEGDEEAGEGGEGDGLME